MYPGYEQYWGAILANPEGVLPFSGKIATKGEIAYARFAEKTPHIVLSKTLDKVSWKNTWIVRDVEEIRNMKQQPGKDMHAVGGATLVSSLMNLELIDELRLDRRQLHSPRSASPKNRTIQKLLPHSEWYFLNIIPSFFFPALVVTFFRKQNALARTGSLRSRIVFLFC
jgi:hypothetical protein